MAIFEPINFKYRGMVYTIPPERVLKAIACVEEHITIGELAELEEKGAGMPMARIAQAFAAVLRFSGAQNASDDEVYESLFEIGGQVAAAASVSNLLLMCIPPSTLKAAGKNLEKIAAGKLKPGRGKRSQKTRLKQ